MAPFTLACSLPRLGNTRLLQSAPARPWPGNKLCQAWGGGKTREHDSCYFLEATVGHNPDSCPAPHSTGQPLPGSGLQQGTPSPASAPSSSRVPPRLSCPLHWYRQEGGAGCTFWPGLGERWSLQGSTGGGGSPSFPPPACLPTRLLPPAPHTPNSLHACLSLTARANTWLRGHPLF